MALFNAETIVLSEEESLEFVNDLIHPDSDYIARRNAIFEATDSRMTITECEDGFVVDVPDFDFSAIMAQSHNEISVSFDIKADEIYEALMKLANSVSHVCNQIVSNEFCLAVSTWNNHGKTTEGDVPVVSQSVENKVKIDSNGGLDLAA